MDFCNDVKAPCNPFQMRYALVFHDCHAMLRLELCAKALSLFWWCMSCTFRQAVCINGKANLSKPAFARESQPWEGHVDLLTRQLHKEKLTGQLVDSSTVDRVEQGPPLNNEFEHTAVL